MSEFIRKQDLIEATRHLPIRITKEEFGWVLWFNISDILDKLPSVEPEHKTAKVIEHDASITDTNGYKYMRSEYLCDACKKKVLGGDEYCSHCGARLEWE